MWRSLTGRKQADVLAHAITDAILGAAALGDIGMHFPDSDPRWKGADSLRFLRHARDLVADSGFSIVHIDSTVILEKPKLKDFRQAIREQIAEALELPLDRVSVKFKTAEGRTGRRGPFRRGPGRGHSRPPRHLAGIITNTGCISPPYSS